MQDDARLRRSIAARWRRTFAHWPISSQRKAFAGSYNDWPRGRINRPRTWSGRNNPKRVRRGPRLTRELRRRCEVGRAARPLAHKMQEREVGALHSGTDLSSQTTAVPAEALTAAAPGVGYNPSRSRISCSWKCLARCSWWAARLRSSKALRA
jgi:hypothetical protein